jgi:ribose 1,5-bisphosphokinase
MTGAWVFVCGPSGAGKDSVIASARQTLSSRQNIVFSRRMVTRVTQAGSDHDPLTESDFHALAQAGGLCWHWQAHGFFYGIAQHYAADVNAGRIVVINGSRSHVNQLPPSPGVRVVHITAAPDQLATRLRQRGRDGLSAVAERLARNARFEEMKADCVIVNDAELPAAGRRLADYLSSSV